MRYAVYMLNSVTSPRVSVPVQTPRAVGGGDPEAGFDPVVAREHIESFLQQLPTMADAQTVRDVRAAVTSMLSEASVLLARSTSKFPMQLVSTDARIKRVEQSADPAAALRDEHLDAPLGNFGVVADGALYRGAQPSRHGLQWLASKGIRTVVTLRMPEIEDHLGYVDFTSAQEASECGRLGMKSIAIPIVDRTLPAMEQVKQFLDILADPANQPVYVHCKAGIGRTGIMCGIYQRLRGTPTEQVVEDFQKFDPRVSVEYVRAQVDFVRDYPLRQA